MAALRSDSQRKRAEWTLLARWLAGDDMGALAERRGVPLAEVSAQIQAALLARTQQRRGSPTQPFHVAQGIGKALTATPNSFPSNDPNAVP